MPPFNHDKRFSFRSEADVIKRVNANLIERKRMEKINHGFENLKKLLPPPERKLSKSAVLQQAVQHIKLLQRTVVQIKMENQELKRRIDELSTLLESGTNDSPVKIQSVHTEDELKENMAILEMTQEPKMTSEGSVDRYNMLSIKQKEDMKTVYKDKQSRGALTGLSNFSLNENYCPNWPRNFSEKKQKISPNLKPVHRFNDGTGFAVPPIDYSFPAPFTPGLVLQLARSNTQKALPALANYKRIAPYPWKPQASLQPFEKSPSAIVGRVSPFQSTMNRPQTHQSKINKPRCRRSRQQHSPNPAVNSLDTIIEAIEMIENDPKHEINPSRSTRADKNGSRGSV